MLQNNNNYLQNSLGQLNNSASQFHDVVSLSTNTLSNLLNVLKTIKYNETNISKSSLVHLQKTGDLLVTKNGDKYKDAIQRVITDSDQNVLAIQENIDKFRIKFGYNSNEMSNFLIDTLKQVVANEQRLNSVYESILKPIEILKRVLPKIQENLSLKDALRENEIVFEHMMVIYLKCEYIINLISNQDLIHGWNAHCEYKIFKLMDDKKCNWKLILPAFVEKYKSFQIHKDVYYYFMPEDVLPSLPNINVNQKYIPITDEIKKKFDELSPQLGEILNSFILLYGDKIKKITSTNILSSYKYPIVPTDNNSLGFLSKPFGRSSDIDPMLGAGYVTNNGTVINYDNLVIDSFGNGDFTIRQFDQNYLTAFGDVLLGSGPPEKKKRSYDFDDEFDDEFTPAPNPRTSSEPKKSRTESARKIYDSPRNKNVSNIQIYNEMVKSLNNISQLKTKINKANSEHLIENLISIDNYLNIEYHNKILSGSGKRMSMINETDLRRARNHLNYLRLMNERSHTYDSILNNFDTILEKAILFVARIRSKNVKKLCLENFYIKSNLIIQILNKIESMSQDIKCADMLIWKLNEWKNPSAMQQIDDLTENFDKHFERNKNDSKRIKLKSAKVEEIVEKWYIEKINNIEKSNEVIRKKRSETKEIIFKYISSDNKDESKVIDFFKKQKKISDYSFINIYQANYNYEESLKMLTNLRNVGENFKNFLDQTDLLVYYVKLEGKNPEEKKKACQGFLSDFVKKKNLNFNIDPDFDDALLFLFLLNNLSYDVVAISNTIPKSEDIPLKKINYTLNYIPISNTEIQIFLRVLANLNFNSKDPFNLLMNEDEIDHRKNLENYINDNIKDKLELVSDKHQLEKPNEISNIVDLIQSTRLDILFNTACNYVINPIGPSSCGKSVLIFAKEGILSDVLNYNAVNCFYYIEWYAIGYPMEESIINAINNPIIFLFYLDNDTNKFDYEISDRFRLENKYKIAKYADYSSFTEQISSLKKNRTLTAKDTGINPDSSRGFSYVIVEMEKNGKKYFKTVLDSPGLETLISLENEKLKTVNCYSKIMWSSPLICSYLAAKNELKLTNTDLKMAREYKKESKNSTLNASISDFELTSIAHEVDKNNLNKYTLPKFFSEANLKIENAIKKIIFSTNNSDLNSLFINDEFWNLKIGPEIPKNLFTSSYIDEFGIKSESITLGEFFNIENFKILLKKTKLSFQDIINPLFGLPLAHKENIIFQIGKNIYYSTSDDTFSMLSNQIFSLPGSEYQNLQIGTLNKLTFFIAFYSFFYRVLKNEPKETNPIQNYSKDIFSMAFKNQIYDEYMTLLYESIIINEVNILCLCNNKNGITFNKKNSSMMRAPCNFAQQAYEAVYMFKEFDYCLASMLKTANKSFHFNPSSIASKNIDDSIISRNLPSLKEKIKATTALSSFSIEKEDNLEEMFESLINNFIGNYIFNEHFCDKNKLALESDVYDKSLFLKNSSTLNIYVLSAVLLERESMKGKKNAAESYTTLFYINKNSNNKLFTMN